MKLIVGLGNPGAVYEKHLHNTGFIILDQLAHALNAPPFHEKFSASITKSHWEHTPYILMKPMTYMNHSGRAVSQCSKYFKIPTEEIVVIYDDWDLPSGKARFRLSGGHGGHNGIRSIIESLGTQNFKRVRLGIDPPPNGMERAHYVLSNWKGEHWVKLQKIQSPVIKGLIQFISNSVFENTSFNIALEEQKEGEA